MPIAKVADDSPLTVQVGGATVAAQLKDVDLPAVAVDDDVWVEYDAAQRKYVVLAKLGAA